MNLKFLLGTYQNFKSATTANGEVYFIDKETAGTETDSKIYHDGSICFIKDNKIFSIVAEKAYRDGAGNEISTSYVPLNANVVLNGNVANTQSFTTIINGALTVENTASLKGTTTARTIKPEADNTYSLGSSTSNRWAHVYAVKFHGELDGAASGLTTAPSVTWGAGSPSGPTITVTAGGKTSSAATIPSASGTASGIVTTGAQTFGGAKTFASTVQVNNVLSAFGGSIQLGSTSEYATISYSADTDTVTFTFA